MGGVGGGEDGELFRLILVIYQVYFMVTLKTEHFWGLSTFSVYF